MSALGNPPASPNRNRKKKGKGKKPADPTMYAQTSAATANSQKRKQEHEQAAKQVELKKRLELKKQLKQEMLETVQAGIRKKDQNMSDEGAAAPVPAHAAHVASRV